MAKPEKEALLSRWSRLKRESAARRPETGGDSASDAATQSSDVKKEAHDVDVKGSAHQPMAELPPIESLTPESDYQGFMDPRVDDAVRRAALKTLFRSPDFNVADGLDVYAEDYTKLEKLSPAIVAGLKYAQRTLFATNEEGRHEDGARSQSAEREAGVLNGREAQRAPRETEGGVHESAVEEDRPAHKAPVDIVAPETAFPDRGCDNESGAARTVSPGHEQDSETE